MHGSGATKFFVIWYSGGMSDNPLVFGGENELVRDMSGRFSVPVSLVEAFKQGSKQAEAIKGGVRVTKMSYSGPVFDRNLRKGVWGKFVSIHGPEGVEGARRVFEQELDNLANMEHPHIVPVYDLIEIPISDNETVLGIAMEKVKGKELGKMDLTDGELMVVARQVADALDFVASKGVVHCDVKPANILVVKEYGQLFVRVTDFGSSFGYAKGDRQDDQTRIRATKAFAPPEIIFNEVDNLSGASDQFSLAMSLYWMLMKKRIGEVRTKRIHTQGMIPLENVNGVLSQGVLSVLEKARSDDPDDRYRSCMEMVAELEKALEAEKRKMLEKQRNPD